MIHPLLPPKGEEDLSLPLPGFLQSVTYTQNQMLVICIYFVFLALSQNFPFLHLNVPTKVSVTSLYFLQIMNYLKTVCPTFHTAPANTYSAVSIDNFISIGSVNTKLVHQAPILAISPRHTAAESEKYCNNTDLAKDIPAQLLLII